MAVRIEVKWRRGSWLARLDGEDVKYGLRREFESGTPVKSRHILVFEPVRPGWYEISECGRRRYVAVDELHSEPIPDSAIGMLDRISGGPKPGEPGAWYGDRCACGAGVEGFDSDGWPWCSEHEPAAVEGVEAVA